MAKANFKKSTKKVAGKVNKFLKSLDRQATQITRQQLGLKSNHAAKTVIQTGIATGVTAGIIGSEVGYDAAITDVAVGMTGNPDASTEAVEYVAMLGDFIQAI